MGQAAAKTGIMPTVFVAVEQSFPKSHRVIDDPWALGVLQCGPRMLVRLFRLRWMRDWLIGLAEKSDPGMWGGLLVRKRYIDEKVTAFRGRIEALVGLGAGFDTRSLRLPALSGLPIWEIDQRENIEVKGKRLRKSLGEIPANIKLLAMDFDRDDLDAKLTSQGYLRDKRTFFVWEAVTQYLTEEGVRATSDWLAKAAPGSLLAFTYVRKSFLTGEMLCSWESGYKRFVETGIWLFGMEPQDCPTLLRNYGWRLIEDVAYDELATKYISPTDRSLSSTQVERIVYAEKVEPWDQ
jgi:methyltransferase (TIGR00027 family)